MGGKSKNRANKAPVERLEHSHRRLEERLEELKSFVDAIVTGRQVEENWAAIADLVDYLNRSVLRHEEDEELSVFPRLRSHPTLRPLLQRLSDDHISQRKLVDKLAQLVETRGEAKSAAATHARLQRVCKSLSAAYLDHIAREDRQLLPAIARHCSAEDEVAMAQEMGARRDRDQ